MMEKETCNEYIEIKFHSWKSIQWGISITDLIIGSYYRMFFNKNTRKVNLGSLSEQQLRPNTLVNKWGIIWNAFVAN